MSSLMWKQQPDPATGEDAWLLVNKGFGGAETIIVITKKQPGGNWRTSFNQDVAKTPGFNAPSLNQASKYALDHLSTKLPNVPLPWVDNSVYKVPEVLSTLPNDPKQLFKDLGVQAPVSAAPPPTHVGWQGQAVSTTVKPYVPSESDSMHFGDDTAPSVVEEPAVQVDLGRGHKSHFKYKEGKKMSTMNILAEAAIHGGKVGLADEAGNATLGMAEAIFGDAYPDLCKTPAGKTAMKMSTAFLLHVLASEYPSMMPGGSGEAIQAAATMIVEAGARDLVQPNVAKLTPLLTQLAQVGAASLATK